MSNPDPLIEVLMDTMLFENKETAALLLCRLEEKGFAIKRTEYGENFETEHTHLSMACNHDYSGRQELSDLIDELLGTFRQEWIDEYYVPELLFDQLLVDFCILSGGDVEFYGDQWFGARATLFDFSAKKRYIYWIECDSPLHGLLSIWKAAKTNGHFKEV